MDPTLLRLVRSTLPCALCLLIAAAHAPGLHAAGFGAGAEADASQLAVSSPASAGADAATTPDGAAPARPSADAQAGQARQARQAGQGQQNRQDWQKPIEEAASMEGQVILITGSTGGLGREIARSLAASGAHIIVHGRSEERGAALVSEIEEEGIGSARFYRADLASFEQVRELGEAILRDYDRLDVLVNNAGIWLESSDGRRTSEDGHELHFQVNYLSGFLLTRMLLPLIVDSAPSRIVNVSSIAQRPIDFDDVMIENDYSEGLGYAQSKLAQVLFTFDLAEELEGTGVIVNALHPATMMDTDMVLSRGATPRADVADGMNAVLHLVTAPDLESGQYFNGTNPTRAHEQAYDTDARARLRRLSEELTGAR